MHHPCWALRLREPAAAYPLRRAAPARSSGPRARAACRHPAPGRTDHRTGLRIPGTDHRSPFGRKRTRSNRYLRVARRSDLERRRHCHRLKSWPLISVYGAKRPACSLPRVSALRAACAAPPSYGFYNSCMGELELEGIAARLYALPFDDFVAARTAAAKEVAASAPAKGPAAKENRSL